MIPTPIHLTTGADVPPTPTQWPPFRPHRGTLRHLLTWLGAAMVVVLLGCRSSPPRTAVTEVLPDTVRAEARRDALAAIETGRLCVCETGTIALYLPGIPAENAELVRGLPRRPLPAGCIDPRVSRSIAYAEVFNAEILKHLLEAGR